MTTDQCGQHPASSCQPAAGAHKRAPRHRGLPSLATLGVATPADAATLAAIHAAAFVKADAWSRDVFSLHLGLPNVVGLLAGKDGFILVRLAADEADVLTLAVRPEARRNGTATELLHAACLRLAAAGTKVLFLEVSEKNTAARALYLRIGFIDVGRRPGYYSDRSDARVLRIDLAAPV